MLFQDFSIFFIQCINEAGVEVGGPHSRPLMDIFPESTFSVNKVLFFTCQTLLALDLDGY